MAKITLRGTPFNTSGALPAKGQKAPDFKLTKGDLSDVSLKDFAGKVKVLSINPSLDTEVCALSAKKFNAEVDKLSNTVIINVSRDLPFATNRFCKSEGINSLVAAVELRNRDFGKNYGMEIVDGPFAGVLARGVVVIDKNDVVVHAELVEEVANEPNYKAALEAVKASI